MSGITSSPRLTPIAETASMTCMPSRYTKYARTVTLGVRSSACDVIPPLGISARRLGVNGTADQPLDSLVKISSVAKKDLKILAVNLDQHQIR